MYDFLKSTAWGMQKPAAYGPFHLTFLVVGLALCVLFAYLLRKSDDKRHNAILLSVGVFLLVCEVYKQLFYTYYIGKGEYQWWIFPFQLCSVPMYLCTIIPFVKNKKINKALCSFLASFNLLGGFIALFEPSGLSHEYVTLTLHAFIWHIALVFVGFYLIASNRTSGSLKEFKSAVIIFILLACIAQAINITFHQHDIKMFYISPYHSTPLIVFKQIEEACGWFVNMIVYIIALTLGSFIFNRINWFINKRVYGGELEK